MLIFNNNSSPLVLFVIFIYTYFQATSASYKNFQFVKYDPYDTATVKIILEKVPENVKNTIFIYGNNTVEPRSYSSKEFELDITLNAPAHLEVVLVFEDGRYFRESVIKFILKDKKSGERHACLSHCTIVLDNWKWLKLLNTSHKTNEGSLNEYDYEKVSYHIYDNTNRKDISNVRVVFENIPKGVYYAALKAQNGNAYEFGMVNGPEYHFVEIKLMLVKSYDNSTIEAELMYENKTVYGKRLIIKFSLDHNMGTGHHKCLTQCTIFVDWKEKRDDKHNAWDEQTHNLPSKLTEKTSTTEKYLYKNSRTDVRTTNLATTEKYQHMKFQTDMRTTNLTSDKEPNISTESFLIFIIPSVVGFLILVTVFGFLYRRYKKSNIDNDNQYFYASQLSYADLQLDSSDLYEAPNTDYVSVYTRIIGILKPK